MDRIPSRPELRTVYPDDPRVTLYLPERWASLSFLGRRADIHAEIGEVLLSAKDPALKKEALLFETGLRFLEPIDGRTEVSLAETFARQSPRDSRIGELFRLAAARLDDDWYLRLGLLLILGLAGAFTLSTAWMRRLGARAWLRIAGGSGGLVLGVLTALLFAFRLLSYDRQNAIYAYYVAMLNAFRDPTFLRRAGFIAYSLMYKVPQQLENIASSVRMGVTVALASATAFSVVIANRRLVGTPIPWTSTLRMAVVSSFTVLAVSVGLDAFMIARQASTVRDRIARDYPGLSQVRLDNGEHRMCEHEAHQVVLKQRQRERIGEPFDLEFADAITGRRVSTNALRGKVVVVDFWATVHGLFAARVPKMKQLYAKYRDKGVEFIGVSLDLPEQDGGLLALKAFVAREQIAWLQYYQDLDSDHRVTRPKPADRLLASVENYEGFDSNRPVPGTAASEFAKSWGVNSLLTVFVIDAEGRLHSTDAQRELDTLIPRLLKKSGDSSAGR